MAIDQDKLHEFLVKAIVDFGATFNAALIRIGDKLGLFQGPRGRAGRKHPRNLRNAPQPMNAIFASG